MFEAIKKIFSKSNEKAPSSSLTLDELPSWLDEQEEQCVSRRTAASKKSREKLLRLEEELSELLKEFGDESSDEPHHHKVEQVNRHALPQFCRKIEAELDGEFSEDDEVFYREVAGLINGCFKAYKGPGRYLHHLYPEEVKVFRQTLDQMGQELNRMTEVIRVSRERLSRIEEIREILHERETMKGEATKAGEEEQAYESRLSSLTTDLNTAKTTLDTFISSDEYSTFMDLENRVKELADQAEHARESLESQVRIALPVWKRAEKIFQEQGKPSEQKQMEDLVHMASAPRRDNMALAHTVAASAKALFSLLDSDTLHSKNSFEKSLLTTSEEYSGKFTDLCSAVQSLTDQLETGKIDLEKSPIGEKKVTLEHQIDDISRRIETLHLEEKTRTEKLSGLKEKQQSSLQVLQEKFAVLTDEEISLIFPGEES